MSEYLALLLISIDSQTALYLSLFSLLILTGFGFPLTEEIILILGGYLAYLGLTNFWATCYILVAGILAADIIGYTLGRWAGDWIYKKISRFRFARILVEKAQKYFERYGEKVVFFSRPIPNIRSVVPILAGHFRMKFSKFLIFDVIASVPWTIFLVSLSYYLGSGLDLITEVKEIKHAVFILLAIAAAVYALRTLIKNRSVSNRLGLMTDKK